MMKKSLLGRQERKQLAWFDDHYSYFSKEEYQLENWRKSILRRLFDQSWSKHVKKYLDVGCGATGYTVIEAAKKGWLALGADISIEAMLRAKSLAEKQGVASQTAFVVCSAEKLPFKKNLFDYVSILSVLEHLANDRSVMEAVSQIVTPKGYCYICVPNTYKRMWLFLWPVYYYFDKKIGHQRHYGVERLREEMRKVGFVERGVVYNGHLVKLFQLVLEKLGIINDDWWWQLENKDLSQNQMGVQLNVYYQKK
jgi:2-polyprenyl-3-methyl-5-hydroxy-6-metoxy-1,4-benzoquinol methylase